MRRFMARHRSCGISPDYAREKKSKLFSNLLTQTWRLVLSLRPHAQHLLLISTDIWIRSTSDCRLSGRRITLILKPSNSHGGPVDGAAPFPEQISSLCFQALLHKKKRITFKKPNKTEYSYSIQQNEMQGEGQRLLYIFFLLANFNFT